MAKKRKNKDRKAHIKHKAFQDLNISSMDDHKRNGGVLSPPLAALNKLGGMGFISWKDNALNEVLWAVLLRGNMEQKDCLDLFRHIVANAREHLPDRTHTFITHSTLSAMTDEQFDVWVQPILKDARAIEYLRAIRLFDCLPDRKHWDRHIPEPTPDEHFPYAMAGVAACFDHQSQEATDIRWLKVVYALVVGDRLRFSQEQSELVEELRLYPDYGDQRKVRPSIRAMEISFRGCMDGETKPMETPQEIKDKVPEPWHEAFWKECFDKTLCMTGKPAIADTEDKADYQAQFIELYQKVAEHFVMDMETTTLNEKRDAVFGIVLYAFVLAIGAARGSVHYRAEGRILLRTIVEGFITLKFLEAKDDQTIWEQFRNYGSGQSKLAFLKNLREEDLPDFINLQELYTYANEDYWQEYTDINLKSWSEKNLRKMAEEAGVKDFYDRYYDWSSGYVHGHWGAIRDTVFTVCVNPLHRYHRIPFVPRLDMQSVLPDMAKIINMMLDVVNHLYPSFKPRIKHQKVEQRSEKTSQKEKKPKTT